MNLAQTITLILGVLAILSAVIKDIYSSKGHQEVLQKEHQNIIDKLTSIFSEIKSTAENIISEIKSNISKTEKIQDSVNSIDKQIAIEAIRRRNLEKNLTKEQLDAQRQIQAISFVNDQMKQLQSRNIELLRENSILQDEIENLKNHNRDLQRKLNRGRSNDPER
jgi:chromosome segregation ATPase